MALDRQDIEKRDFPIGRRGYEPDIVDDHLRAIADEMEELRQAATRGRGTASLATAASEQVRAIVEAAESTAGGIQREAEEEARQTRQQTTDEAERARAEAQAQAREHVSRVSEATAVMLQRVDAMENELGALVDSLRTGANRLTADLTLLQGNMGELRASASGGGHAASAELREPDEVELDVDATRGFEAAAVEGQTEPEPVDLGADVLEPEPALEPDPQAPSHAAGEDTEGARLIALNMALNGTPREETDRYLAENFDVPDRAGLLDEVYARVG